MDGSITVFGGTGFIGRHLVPLLLRSGATVRVAVRNPGRVQLTTESAQAAEYIQTDVLDDVAVGAAIAAADAVVNLVGILTETATQTYCAIHVEGARRVALAAQHRGVTRLIHLSALGASLTSPAVSDRTWSSSTSIRLERASSIACSTGLALPSAYSLRTGVTSSIQRSGAPLVWRMRTSVYWSAPQT
jgi:nucleoside-diphosphate-sugar epimerase